MSKLFIIVFFSMIIPYVSAQDRLTNNIDNIYINDNLDHNDIHKIIQNGMINNMQELMFFTSLGRLSNGELRLLRNMIYAQYGLIFKSDDLISFFRKFPWYKGKSSNVDNQLSAIDKININLIKIFENSKNNGDISVNSLYGHWEVGFPVASGSYYPITFNKDGTFSLGYNTMAPHKTISTMGIWDIRDGYLILTIQKDIQQIGGYYVEPYASYAGKYVLEDAQYGELIYQKPITIKLPVGSILEKFYAETKVKTIEIGGWEYVKFND